MFILRRFFYDSSSRNRTLSHIDGCLYFYACCRIL